MFKKHLKIWLLSFATNINRWRTQFYMVRFVFVILVNMSLERAAQRGYRLSIR